MPEVGSKKNHGYGNKIAYAGHNALKDHMKSKGTIQTHSQRFKYAARYFKDNGINDVNKITKSDMENFGKHLQTKVENGEMSKSYAKNIASSTNKTLEVMRGSRDLRIAPSAYVGERSQVRSQPVQTQRATITRGANRLAGAGHDRQAVTVKAARDFGLRLREASRLDYHNALREANAHGKINITEGTKGNRGEYVDRWVPVSKDGINTLREGARLQEDRNNIMHASERYRDFVHSMREARHALRDERVGRIHDLRAAYAAERYEQLTGCRAPVNRGAGDPAPSRETDREARQQLSYELGHGREDVTNAYIGGKG